MHMQEILELLELQKPLGIIEYNSFILKRKNQRSTEMNLRDLSKIPHS